MTAQVWMEGSIMLAALAQTYDVDYFHFLQPIPIWPGNKPFSKEEKDLRLELKNRTDKWTASQMRSYQMLLNRGQKLSQHGVHFYSLAYMFKDIKNTVWIDDISHVNAYGNKLFVQAMADKIQAYYQQEKPQPMVPAASVP